MEKMRLTTPVTLLLKSGEEVTLNGPGDVGVGILRSLFTLTPDERQQEYRRLLKETVSSSDGLVDLAMAIQASPTEPLEQTKPISTSG